MYQCIVCGVRSRELTHVQASPIDLWKGVKIGSRTQWQMTLVFCFAPDRMNDEEGHQVLSHAVWSDFCWSSA